MVAFKQSARIWAGGKAETIAGNDLDLVVSRACEFSLSEGETATVRFTTGRWVSLNPATYRAVGVKFKGAGRTTEWQFKGTAGASVNVPDPSGTGMKTIMSGCYGLYVRSDSGTVLKEAEIRDITIVGHTGSPALANEDVRLVQFAGHQCRANRVFTRFDESDVADASLFTPYKQISSRMRSLTALAFGEDLWVEPSTARAQPVHQVEVSECYPFGEPLLETGGNVGTAAAHFLWIRKGIGGFVQQINFAQEIDERGDIIYDLIGSSAPVNGDAITLAPWNPYLRRSDAITLTWRSKAQYTVTFSGVPADNSTVVVAALSNDQVSADFTKKDATFKFHVAAGIGTDDPIARLFWINTTANASANACATALAAAINANFNTASVTAGIAAPVVTVNDLNMGQVTDLVTKTGDGGGAIAIATVSQGVLATGNDMYLGATHNEAFRNAVAKTRSLSVRNGGAYHFWALNPEEFGNAAATNVIRFTSTQSPRSDVNSFQYGTPVGGTQELLVNSGYATGLSTKQRIINVGKRRQGCWASGIVLEDSPFVIVSNINTACTQFSSYAVVAFSTMRLDDYSQFEWAEGGHKTISGFIGDGCTVGKGYLGLFGAGFDEIRNVNTGQTQEQSATTIAPIIDIDQGFHKSYTLDLVTGNAAAGNTVTIDDGVNAARTFTFKRKKEMTITFAAGLPADESEILITPLVYQSSPSTAAKTSTPARIRFKAASVPADNFEDRIFYVNTTTAADNNGCAAAVNTIINAKFPNTAVTSTVSTNVVTVKEATWGENTTLVVETADSGTKMTEAAVANTGQSSVNFDVLIGADAQTSQRALRERILAARMSRLTYASVSEDGTNIGSGTYRIIIQFTPRTYVVPTASVTKSGANLTATEDSQPFRPASVKIEMNPHWKADSKGFGSCVLRAKKCYGALQITGKIYHQRFLNPTKLAQGLVMLRFNDLTGTMGAATTSVVTIDSASDAAKTFQFDTAGDVPPAYHTGATTSGGDAASKLATKINSLSFGFKAFAIDKYCFIIDTALGSTSDALFVETTDNGDANPVGGTCTMDTVQLGTVVFSGVPVNNATITMNVGDILNNFVFKDSPPADVIGSPSTYYIDRAGIASAANAATALNAKIAATVTSQGFVQSGVDAGGVRVFVYSTLEPTALPLVTTPAPLLAESGDGGGAYVVKQFLTGSATATQQTLNYPIVLEDIACWDVSGLMGMPFVDGGYNGTTFIEGFAITGYPLTHAFLGFPVKLLYASKTGAGVTSVGSMTGNKLFGPWGFGSAGAAKLYELGPNMTSADVITPSNANYVNGSAV